MRICVRLCDSMCVCNNCNGFDGAEGNSRRAGKQERRPGWGGDTREEMGEGGRLWWSNREAEKKQWQMQKLRSGGNGTGVCGRYSYQLTPVNSQLTPS